MTPADSENTLGNLVWSLLIYSWEWGIRDRDPYLDCPV